MGKLVKNKKSLLIIAIILFVLSNNLFSQNTSSEDLVSQNLSSFENNTDYFNDAGSANLNIDSNSVKAPSTAGLIIRMIVVLALVVAALYGLMIFFKKKNSNTKSDDDFLRRVSSLNLSPGKSVEIVTLVDRGFILGVTESNINLIAEIEDKEMISALNLNFDKKQNTKKPMNFADVLDMFMPNGPRNNSSIYSDVEASVDRLSRNSVIQEENSNPEQTSNSQEYKE